MILSAKETTVQSVGIPSIMRAACLVTAGKGLSSTASIVMVSVGMVS